MISLIILYTLSLLLSDYTPLVHSPPFFLEFLQTAARQERKKTKVEQGEERGGGKQLDL